MTDRGKIRNREYAQQLNDFSGLRFGKITPTDIDGFLDFGDKVFIIVESKHGGSEMPYGQRLALERLCDACEDSGRATYLMLCSHNTDSEDIDYANIRVKACRRNKQWKQLDGVVTLRDAINKILDKHNISFQ